MEKEFYCKTCNKDYPKDQLLKFLRCPECGKFVKKGNEFQEFQKQMILDKFLSQERLSTDDVVKLKMIGKL